MTQLEPEEARQGRKGTPVLKVLIAALALCVVAFIGLGFYGWQMPDANMPGPLNGSGVANVAPATAPSPGSPAGQAPSNPPK